MSYRASVGAQGYHFADLREVLAKASPARSGDALAGIAPPWPGNCPASV